MTELLEENEHDVVDNVNEDILPRIQQSDMVVNLKNMAGDKYLFACLDSFEWKAAEYILELEEKIKKLEKALNETQ
mgnify:FL=1